MKMTLHLLTLTVLALGCSSSSNDTKTTTADETRLIEEVKPLVHQMLKASENRDIKAATASYWHSPQFIYVTNGQQMGYEAFEKGNADYFALLKGQVFISKDETYRVLGPHVVLVNWIGKVDADLKDGKKFVADPAVITFLFKKVDAKDWKVVYTNESMQGTNISVPQ